MIFRKRSLKEIFFGKKAALQKTEEELLSNLEDDFSSLAAQRGRRGQFRKKDPIHKGVGTVYLIPNVLGDPEKESLLVFSSNTRITSGPDLYPYLSTQADPRKGLGEYINLGLLKGSKGGQTYTINMPLSKLEPYKSVVIYCKAFEVLFTWAELE